MGKQVLPRDQRFDFFSAAPRCIAMWSISSLSISYCGPPCRGDQPSRAIPGPRLSPDRLAGDDNRASARGSTELHACRLRGLQIFHKNDALSVRQSEVELFQVVAAVHDARQILAHPICCAGQAADVGSIHALAGRAIQCARAVMEIRWVLPDALERRDAPLLRRRELDVVLVESGAGAGRMQAKSVHIGERRPTMTTRALCLTIEHQAH
jgi:hypothetical protein